MFTLSRFFTLFLIAILLYTWMPGMHLLDGKYAVILLLVLSGIGALLRPFFLLLRIPTSTLFLMIGAIVVNLAVFWIFLASRFGIVIEGFGSIVITYLIYTWFTFAGNRYIYKRILNEK